MESSKYGWFWECPNGGKKCHYRHALPPGTALSPGSLWEENWIIWRRDPIFRLSKTRYNTASSLTGFVLKKDQKKEDKGSTITIEELIEKEVITFLWSIFLLFSNIYWCLFFFYTTWETNTCTKSNIYERVGDIRWWWWWWWFHKCFFKQNVLN